MEGLELDDAEKNRLCPPVPSSGEADRSLGLAYSALVGQLARAQNVAFKAWNDVCRLNPARGAPQRKDDPEIVAAYTAIFSSIGPAMRNLASRTASSQASAADRV